MSEFFSKYQLCWLLRVVSAVGSPECLEEYPLSRGRGEAKWEYSEPSYPSETQNILTLTSFLYLRSIHSDCIFLNGIWELTFGNQQLFWELTFLFFVPLEFKNNIPVLYDLCQGSERIGQPVHLLQVLSDSDVTSVGWETWLHLRCPELLTPGFHSCSPRPQHLSQDAELPISRGSGRPAGPSSSVFCVICYHDTPCPEQRGCVFLVLLPPITEKSLFIVLKC